MKGSQVVGPNEDDSCDETVCNKIVRRENCAEFIIGYIIIGIIKSTVLFKAYLRLHIKIRDHDFGWKYVFTVEAYNLCVNVGIYRKQ